MTPPDTIDGLRLRLIDTQLQLIQTQAALLQYQRAEIAARLNHAESEATNEPV